MLLDTSLVCRHKYLIRTSQAAIVRRAVKTTNGHGDMMGAITCMMARCFHLFMQPVHVLQSIHAVLDQCI